MHWSEYIDSAIGEEDGPPSGDVDCRVEGTAELPAGFDRLVAAVGEFLRSGPGFVLIRGLPVQTAGARRTARLFADLCARFGRLLDQNIAGDLIYLVKNTGLPSERQYGSRGSGDLLFHTDQAAAPPELLPRTLGLLAFDRAAAGGETRLASGHTVVNALLDRDPSLATALTELAPFGRDADGVSAAPPVSAQAVEIDGSGRARLRFNRYFMEVGARQLDRQLSPEVTAALDAVDEVLADDALTHTMLLEPGDGVVIDNTVVFHNRAAYEDDLDHQRCLARLWAR